MRAGLSSYTYTWAVGVPGHPPVRPLTAQQLLTRCAQLGAAVLQVADNLPLHELSPAEISALDGQAREHGIALEIGTRGIDEPNLRAYLAIAVRLGSPLLRTIVSLPDRDVGVQEAVSRLRTLQLDFQRAGVRLAIENHDRLSTDELAQVVELLGTEWTGICLDTVNSFGALEGPGVVVDKLGPFTVNVHVKDFEVRRLSHMMGFAVEGTPLGRGRLDVHWLINRLGGAKRDLSAIVELWTPPEGDLALTIDKERQWAETSIAYLRNILSLPEASFDGA